MLDARLHEFFQQLCALEALQRGDPDRMVVQIALELEQLYGETPFTWGGWSEPGDYRGQLLFEDLKSGLIAVGMTWGPGAETPIHDHGTWGAMLVLEEAVEISNFKRVGEDGIVENINTFLLNPGDATWLVPPHREIHRVRNPGKRIARSMHIYGRNIGF